jgi:glutathione S-transferase
VLVDGDEVVSDSPVILDWLEERFPEPPLYPRDPARRAEVQVFVQWFNGVWKQPPNLIDAEELKPEPDRDLIAELGTRMQDAIRLFESLLDGRDYLFGEFGMADVVAFPFLKYASFGVPPGDDERFHEILVEFQSLADGSPLHAWARRVDSRARS